MPRRLFLQVVDPDVCGQFRVHVNPNVAIGYLNWGESLAG